MSRSGKRILAIAIGGAYAMSYGFWTMLLTGGGHVNFIWFMLFLFVEGFGLYFPTMAFLLVDLRSFFSRVIFGSLICFNLIASFVMIHGWVNEPDGDRPSDYSRTIQVNGFEDVLLFALIHFLPTLVFLSLLIWAMVRGKPPDRDRGIYLDLS